MSLYKNNVILSPGYVAILQVIMLLDYPITIRKIAKEMGHKGHNQTYEAIYALKKAGLIDFNGTATIRPLVRFIPAEKL